jgi:hypothetical protein
MNCTISGNYARHNGGGLAGGNMTVTNSIVWGNTAGSGSPQIDGSGYSVTYTDVEGGYSGTGNMNADPQFIDFQQASLGNPTTAGDFHLQSGSPVEGQGTSAGAPAVDRDGDSRPLGTGVDMGSDEIFPNDAPTLSWTGEAGYVADGVDPDSAAGGSSFTFRIDYTDADNNAPSYIQVWIDEDDSGTYEAGEKYDLTAVDGGDTDYSDGKRYSVTRALTYDGDGDLNYRFAAADGAESATGAPTGDSTVTVIYVYNCSTTTFIDEDNAAFTVYSDSGYSNPICSDALAANTDYYIQISDPALTDIIRRNQMTLWNAADSSLNFGDGTGTETFYDAGSNRYRASFRTPSTEDVYFLEIRLENNSKNRDLYMRKVPITVGSSGYIKYFSDAGYSTQTETFAPNDMMYVEIYSPSLSDTSIGSGTSVDLNAFDDVGATIGASSVSKPASRTYRMAFQAPGASGARTGEIDLEDSIGFVFGRPGMLVDIQ